MPFYTIGIFDTHQQIDGAVAALQQAGAHSAAMTLLTAADLGAIQRELGAEPAQGALEGALLGGGIGTTLGALGTIAVASLPGVGPILVSGAIASLSSGLLGGYLGALYGTRAETEPAIKIANAVSADSIVLVVESTRQDDAHRYEQVLRTLDSTWSDVIEDEPNAQSS